MAKVHWLFLLSSNWLFLSDSEWLILPDSNKGEIPAIYAGYLVRMHPILIDSDYINYVMQSQYYWIYCQNVRSDAIGQSNINAEKLKHFILPLPPLQEQKRIVNKISCIISRVECL